MTFEYSAASAPKISRSFADGVPWISAAYVSPFCLNVSSITATGTT